MIRQGETEMIRLELNRRIVKTEEKTYVDVPFEVNGTFERIEVRYRYPDRGRTVVDLGLKSPDRIAGWSGGARSDIFVGLDKATPGYLSGPIIEGTWSVLLGAYKIPDEGCTVTIEVLLVPPVKRWLKGDLHLHSVHSDGSYTFPEIVELCRKEELNFVALTDHNTASQNKHALAADEHLVIIPAVELTSYYGHANLYGHPDALDDFRVLTPEHAADELRKAGNKGAFISLNHPFCSNCPWELGFDVPFDAIEVWNGPWRPVNEAAVQWWHGQLCLGRRLVALGGSDTHAPHEYVKHGRPTSYVLTETESATGILNGIRKGHIVLSFDSSSTFITLNAGGYQVGDVIDVEGREEIELQIEVSQADGDEIMIWSDRGLEHKLQARNSVTFGYTGQTDRLFYRVEARRYIEDMDLKIMTCLTNPIYVRHTKDEER